MKRSEILRSLNTECTSREESMLYAAALDKAESALRRTEPQFSDFLDPYKAARLQEMFNKGFGAELTTMLWGGFDKAERRMAGFFPQYTRAKESDFPISCVRVGYNGKYSRTPTHRDFLGSVLGLGIKREKVGDILIFEDECFGYILAEREIAAFIASALERVGRTAVKTQLLPVSAMSVPADRGVEKRLTVSSLRLDVVLGAAFNLSRGKVNDLIKGEKVFVNWIPVTSPSKAVASGDMITLRGSGRVRLKEIQGATKKDRIAVILEIFK